ncbi:queuosine salvage family protein [Candidatus Bipolaricaulota bacterium]
MSKTDRAPDVFNEIRSACRAVAESAQFVRVEQERIPEYARSLPRSELRRPVYDTNHHFVGEVPETVAYIVTLDAVNFGSGYFPHLSKRPSMSGYYSIASALADRFRQQGPLDAEELARIGTADCARLFDQTLDSEPIRELMSLFARAWNDLGAHLLESFEGRFHGLIDAVDGSAARLIALLSRQAFFRDVSAYGGTEVPFFKRAQILASDLALAFDGTGPGRFHDLDRLTIFADNLVPHVLRLDGLLHYDAGLLGRIERGELIPPGSQEEVEIRACAVHAVEEIAECLRASGEPVTPRELDILLWTRGQSPEHKGAPRHRTRSVYY